MSWISASLTLVLSLGMVHAAGGPAFARQSTVTKTEVRPFQVVWVEGNKVIVRGNDGAQEITVPDDFRFDVDGRQVSVRELKPGMKGTATITTTTTVTPVHVTEVRNGQVLRRVGNSLIIRDETGVRRYTEGEIAKRNVQMIRNGRPASFRDFREGDRLTATIVTEGPPEVVTEREVAAMLTTPEPAPQPAPRVTKRTTVTLKPGSAAANATSDAAAAPSGTTSARRLPRTASPLRLVGLLGAASVAIGAALTAVRRRRFV
jgi:hypothetical protein